MTYKPTDQELDALRQADNGELNFVTLRQFRIIARAALAKWGTPAVAGEPVAWVDERAIGWLANSRSGAATITTTLGRQKSFERPMPLHTTPQPTQPQAGAVPLTDDQLAEMMRETWGCASIAPRHAMKFARAIEVAHGIGIKGGQHG